MNKYFLMILLFALDVNAGVSVNPLDYTYSDEVKVNKDIKENYLLTYANTSVESNVVLNMLKNGEIIAFNRLTEVKNRTLLDKIIKENCDQKHTCTYANILIQYNYALSIFEDTGQSMDEYLKN